MNPFWDTHYSIDQDKFVRYIAYLTNLFPRISLEIFISHIYLDGIFVPDFEIN